MEQEILRKGTSRQKLEIHINGECLVGRGRGEARVASESLDFAWHEIGRQGMSDTAWWCPTGAPGVIIIIKKKEAERIDVRLLQNPRRGQDARLASKSYGMHSMN